MCSYVLSKLWKVKHARMTKQMWQSRALKSPGPNLTHMYTKHHTHGSLLLQLKFVFVKDAIYTSLHLEWYMQEVLPLSNICYAVYAWQQGHGLFVGAADWAILVLSNAGNRLTRRCHRWRQVQNMIDRKEWAFSREQGGQNWTSQQSGEFCGCSVVFHQDMAARTNLVDLECCCKIC